MPPSRPSHDLADEAHTGLLDGHVVARRKPRRSPFVLVAFVSLLAISGVLFSIISDSNQSHSSDPEQSAHDEPPHPSSIPTAAPSPGHEAVSNPLDQPFRLHPTDHNKREPTTISQKWRITSANRRPDGVSKQVYLINDVFPGPTLETRPGDHLVIEVENALSNDEGIAIHWHGLSQRGTNNMDGAVGVTQKPVPPGEKFTYDFHIDEEQHGTFWYHAHEGVQRADGLYGGLVVHDVATPINDDEYAEHLLMVGDWYHRGAQEALEYYSHPGAFGNEAVPDNILFNGEGFFNCEDAVPARPLDCEARKSDDLTKLQLDSGKKNILRVVNVGAYAGLNVSISGATLQPMTLDGGFAVHSDPASVVGVLHPGERVDLLLDGQSDQEESPMTITLDQTPFRYENPSLTPSQKFPVSWNNPSKRKSTSIRASPPPMQIVDLADLRAASDQTTILPPSANETMVIYAITQKMAHIKNEPHGFINHTTWLPQIGEPLITTARKNWDASQFVPHIIPSSPHSKPPRHDGEDDDEEKDEYWVDIVLNNLDEEGHPFHFHGYSVWVLSTFSSDYNWGSYNPFDSAPPEGGEFELKGALRKDTVYVPRRGYAVLRLKADNLGLWMVHCHVLWHGGSGMGMVLEVG